MINDGILGEKGYGIANRRILLETTVECSKTPECAPHKHHFDECVARVTAAEEEEDESKKGKKEDCVEEFFHLAHCTVCLPHYVGNAHYCIITTNLLIFSYIRANARHRNSSPTWSKTKAWRGRGIMPFMKKKETHFQKTIGGWNTGVPNTKRTTRRRSYQKLYLNSSFEGFKWNKGKLEKHPHLQTKQKDM